MQPDDSFDDNAYGQERTTSNPQAVLRKERRAVVALCERTRTRRKVFLNRVAQVRFLSGPPRIQAALHLLLSSSARHLTLILTLIAIVVIGTLILLGPQIASIFQNMSNNQ